MDIFNELLYKEMGNTEESDKKVCLINNEDLTDDNTIKLYCGHDFSYGSIFKEVVSQRKYKRFKEKMKNTDIKCPYCRSIQHGILPYMDGYSKIKFVNDPPEYAMLLSTCTRVILSGKRKGILCGKRTNTEYCTRCSKIKEKRYCSAVIRSGKKKGEQCMNICKNDNYCGKHNLKKKKDST